MADILIPDGEMVRRAQRTIAEFARSRVEIIAARPGNPLGAECRCYGGAIALRVPPFGEHLFNRAIGFTDENLGDARDAIKWYAEKATPAIFEVTPGLPSAGLMALLAESGYRQTGFHATFAGVPESPRHPCPGVEVKRVASETDLAPFSDAYHAGWSSTGARVPMEQWLTTPGWRLYLGLCDGRPAGAGVLYIRDKVGYLADSAVAPAWRRRGVHRALLDARCEAATAAGCAEIYAGAEFLSASYRNMLRKGLAMLMTKAHWRTCVDRRPTVAP